MNFWERQYKKLPKPIKQAVKTNVEAAKIKAQEGLVKIAQPASDIIARKTREAGIQSIGPWVAASVIVLALLYVSRGKK